jgi:hypothetical protein
MRLDSSFKLSCTLLMVHSTVQATNGRTKKSTFLDSNDFAGFTVKLQNRTGVPYIELEFLLASASFWTGS